MSYRVLVTLGALATLVVAPLPGQPQRAAAKAKTATVPRSPDGHPDLSGVWTNATITPMERPARFARQAHHLGRGSHGV